MISLRILSFATLVILGVAAAGDTEASQKQNGADGGNGLSNGMPGCAGGTDPSSDGKFYIKGTKRECNPGKQDSAKLKQ